MARNSNGGSLTPSTGSRPIPNRIFPQKNTRPKTRSRYSRTSTWTSGVYNHQRTPTTGRRTSPTTTTQKKRLAPSLIGRIPLRRWIFAFFPILFLWSSCLQLKLFFFCPKFFYFMPFYLMFFYAYVLFYGFLFCSSLLFFSNILYFLCYAFSS